MLDKWVIDARTAMTTVFTNVGDCIRRIPFDIDA